MKIIELIKRNFIATIALALLISFSAFRVTEVKSDDPYYPLVGSTYLSTPLDLDEEDIHWECTNDGEICAAQFSNPPSPINQTPDGDVKPGRYNEL